MQDNVRDRGREAGAQIRDRAASEVEQRKGDVSDRLERIVGSVRRSSDALRDDEPWLADMVGRGADEVDGFTRSLRSQNVSTIAEGVQSFARRNPGAFLGASVAMGFVLGRVALTAAHREGAVAGSGALGAGRGPSAAERPSHPQPSTDHFVRTGGPEASRSLAGAAGSPAPLTAEPTQPSLHEPSAPPFRPEPAIGSTGSGETPR